jgi:phosphatidylglycerophosphate synthase
VNLPNALTVGRIAITPLVAVLPFFGSATLRGVAFVLFLVAAITDWVDGWLARRDGQITDLGKLLDPLADKLLLFGTFVPMYLLMRGERFLVPSTLSLPPDGRFPALFVTWWVSLPLWIVIVVLGREAFMTAFRERAKRRGIVIAAIGPAKLKTIFQSIWVGGAYAWFFAASLAREQGWTSGWWTVFAQFNGSVIALSMTVATALTLWSLGLYLQRYSSVLHAPARSAAR